MDFTTWILCLVLRSTASAREQSLVLAFYGPPATWTGSQRRDSRHAIPGTLGKSSKKTPKEMRMPI